MTDDATQTKVLQVDIQANVLQFSQLPKKSTGEKTGGLYSTFFVQNFDVVLPVIIISAGDTIFAK